MSERSTPNASEPSMPSGISGRRWLSIRHIADGLGISASTVYKRSA